MYPRKHNLLQKRFYLGKMTDWCLGRPWTAEGGKAQFSNAWGCWWALVTRPPRSPGSLRLNRCLTFISSPEASSSIMWDQDLFPDLLLLVLLLNCRQLCCASLSCLSYSVCFLPYVQLLEKKHCHCYFLVQPKCLLTSVGL